MRNYGRFTTSIYRDSDFRALTAAQQGVYFMLGLQAEVTAAGALSLTLRRWAGMSAGMTPSALRAELAVLEERGHILIDEDTEELLIVKFVKWDGGISNEKRRPVIDEAGCAIASEPIRHRLAHEVIKLGHADMASRIVKDAAPDTQSGFDRVVVTEGAYVPNPSSATPEGEPSPFDASDEPPSPFCSKHPHGTEKSCGPCGTAKMRAARWDKAAPARDAARKAAAQSARENCPRCHGSIWLEDGAKCDHRRTA